MFITIEGIDGSGKSTQARRLAARLRREGKKVTETHEPGDWPQGDILRALLLNGRLRHPMTEIMLFVADRCEHVAQVIQPALDQGEFVVCDRYNDSTRAYQCWGRGLKEDILESLIKWCGIPEPDLTVWLDLPVEEARKRMAGRGGSDRIEGEDLKFHEAVARGFKELAERNGSRFFRVDARAGEDEIEETIFSELKRRCVI